MVQGVTGTKPVAKSTPKRVLFSPPGGDLDCSGANRVHAPARPVTSSSEESDSLWKTCGQDDELAEQVSSAVENEYWRGLDRFIDRKSTRLNSSHSQISYAVFCLK